MATWEIGNIDNSPMGQATPAAGKFTVLKADTDPADADGVGDRGFNDIRYALKSHASKHTDGTDDIQSATAAQKGLATATQILKLNAIEAGATKYPDTGEQIFTNADHTKLDGIETGADVTDTLAIINSIVCYNGEVIIHDGNVISN